MRYSNLLCPLVLLGSAVAAQSEDAFDLPFGDGSRTVRAIYHSETEHWTVEPPRQVRLHVSGSNGAENLDSASECDRRMALYQKFPKENARRFIRPERLVDAGADHYFHVDFKLDGFSLKDERFQAEVQKVAQERGWSLAGIPRSDQDFSTRLGSRIPPDQVRIQWADNAYSKFLGTEALDEDLREFWSTPRALGASMTAPLKTFAMDLTCDLLTGRVEIQFPLMVWMDNIDAKAKTIRASDLQGVYRTLNESFEVGRGIPPKHLRGYRLARAFRDQTKRGLLTVRTDAILQTYREFFEESGELKAYSLVDFQDLERRYAQQALLRYDYELQVKLDQAGGGG